MFKKAVLMAALLVSMCMVFLAVNVYVLQPLIKGQDEFIGKLAGTEETLDKSGYAEKLVYQDKQYDIVRVYRDVESDKKYIQYIFYYPSIGYHGEKTIKVTFKLDDFFKEKEGMLVITEDEAKELLVELY